MLRGWFERRLRFGGPLPALALVMAMVPACDQGTETFPPPSIGAAGIRWAVDWDNAGDASDIRVALQYPGTRAGLAEFRLLAAKAEAAHDLTPDALVALPGDRYLALSPDVREEEQSLPAGLLDTDGDPVTSGVPYRVIAVSVAAEDGSADKASVSDDTVTLENANLVRTLTSPIDAGTGGMDVDAAGLIYLADFGATLGGPPGERVYRVTPAGEVSVFAEGFLGASGNDFDSHGNLFQSSITADRISKVTPDGTVTDFVTEGIDGPVGIVFDAGDTLYVANCQANSVSRVTPAGAVSPFASSPLFACPNGITLADDGNLYVANFNDGRVLRVTPSGDVSELVTLPGGNNGHILFGNGVLYVVDRGGSRIFEVTLDGKTTVLAGNGQRGLRDATALDATLSLTNDVALSPDGTTLYFNDVAAEAGASTTISPTVIRALILVDPGGP